MDNERIDSLSMYYSNQIMFNRLGAGVRFAKNGLNLLAGVSGQKLDIDGKYSLDKGLPLLADPVNQDYMNLAPTLNLTCEFKNGMWLVSNYTYSISEPSFSDLQPVPIVYSITSRTEGNPDLKPERTHATSANLYYQNQSSFASFNISGEYNYTNNAISYNKFVSWVDSVGYVTTTKPSNSSTGQDGRFFIWSNFPLIKTKLTMSVSGNYRFDISTANVNGIDNRTGASGYYANTQFTITPGQKLSMDINGYYSFRNVKYSINKEQNQKILSCGAGLNVKWQFANKFFLEGNFDYSFDRNDLYDFIREQPILNASVRRLLGKKNQFQIRLAAFDIFNKNVYISQSGSQNYFYRQISPTLSRYFMLSLSYNIKGYENRVKKDRFW
jgi:hypothetical protein